jgi:hypothetical protein
MGATALLQGKVPEELIKLVGRWRSDGVFKYLHAQSDPLMNPLASTMLTSASILCSGARLGVCVDFLRDD